MKSIHIISVSAVAIFLVTISIKTSSVLAKELFYSLSIVGILFAHNTLSNSKTKKHNDEHRA